MRDVLRAIIDKHELWKDDGADGYNVAADHLVDAIQAHFATPAVQTVDGVSHIKWVAKAAVLRSRGQNNTLHDIEQAADYLDAAARMVAPIGERAVKFMSEYMHLILSCKFRSAKNLLEGEGQAIINAIAKEHVR
jgi:hypothetical protein